MSAAHLLSAAVHSTLATELASPALRVRAYDWLADRGQAPPDYDPLASPRARRAALEKYQEATTRPSSGAYDASAAQPATPPATTHPAAPRGNP